MCVRVRVCVHPAGSPMFAVNSRVCALALTGLIAGAMPHCVVLISTKHTESSPTDMCHQVVPTHTHKQTHTRTNIVCSRNVVKSRNASKLTRSLTQSLTVPGAPYLCCASPQVCLHPTQNCTHLGLLILLCLLPY